MDGLGSDLSFLRPGPRRRQRLVSVSKITGRDKRGESKSTVLATVVLTPDTTLEEGIHFAHVAGREDVRFTPAADFTAPAGSAAAEFKLEFEAETAGPLQAAAGTLTVISTPVVGRLAVTNAEDALAGRNSDSNAELRLRREQGLALSGSDGTDQIRADVLAVKDVTSCQVFENWTDATDSQGLPPKSFQVVLWDDAGADPDAIAQAIWKSKPIGIQPIGAETGTAIDKKGKPQLMRFSRATAVPIDISFKVTPKAGYVGDAALKLAMATALDGAMGTGQAVSEWDIADAAHGLGAKLSNIRFGPAPAPTADDDIPIGNSSIALRHREDRDLVNELPLHFVDFVRSLGVEPTPAQEVFWSVACGDVQIADLRDWARPLARDMFGDVDEVPESARGVIACIKGADVGFSFFAGLRLLHRALTGEMGDASQGVPRVALAAAPDLKLARQMVRTARAYAEQDPRIAPMILSPAADSNHVRSRRWPGVVCRSARGVGGRAGHPRPSLSRGRARRSGVLSHRRRQL